MGEWHFLDFPRFSPAPEDESRWNPVRSRLLGGNDAMAAIDAAVPHQDIGQKAGDDHGTGEGGTEELDA